MIGAMRELPFHMSSDCPEHPAAYRSACRSYIVVYKRWKEMW